MTEHSGESAPVSFPPQRRYAIEWDEPGAGFIVDLFDGGKPVINFSLVTGWEDAWHPHVNPAGLQALHAIIDTADPAKLARAEAEVDRLREAILAAEKAILGGPNPSESDLRLHEALSPLWAARSGRLETEQ